MADDDQPSDDLKAFEHTLDVDSLLTTPEQFADYLKRAAKRKHRKPSETPRAAATRRYRQRQRRGLAVIRLTLPLYPLVEFLISSGRLSEAESLVREHIERAASTAMLELALRWTETHPTRV